MPFVGKTHRDPVLFPRPQFLDETIIKLLDPFAR